MLSSQFSASVFDLLCSSIDAAVYLPCFVILSEAKDLCNLLPCTELPSSCTGPSARKKRGPHDDTVFGLFAVSFERTNSAISAVT